jgi:hypothetical protein
LESDFNITGCYQFGNSTFSAQLGLLDSPNRDSIVHEECASFQHQEKCTALCSSIFRHAGYESHSEPVCRLADKQKNFKSRIFKKTIQHYWIVGAGRVSYWSVFFYIFSSFFISLTQLILALAYITSQSQSTLAVTLVTLAVGINSATYLGFQINHIDLSPNHSGM